MTIHAVLFTVAAYVPFALTLLAGQSVPQQATPGVEPEPLISPLELFAFATAILVLIANAIQLLRVRKEVREIKVVVKDTKEIRDALNKPLEGDWEVKGEFSKYQGQAVKHFSTGVVSFGWSPNEHRYNIKYIYSVRKARSDKDEITCFSKGTLSADYDGQLAGKTKLSINFEIHSRTSTPDYKLAVSKHFSLEDGRLVKTTAERATQIQFKYQNDETEGTIKFVR